MCITIKVTKIETKIYHIYIYGNQAQTEVVAGFTALKLDNIKYPIQDYEVFFFSGMRKLSTEALWSNKTKVLSLSQVPVLFLTPHTDAVKADLY